MLLILLFYLSITCLQLILNMAGCQDLCCSYSPLCVVAMTHIPDEFAQCDVPLLQDGIGVALGGGLAGGRKMPARGRGRASIAYGSGGGGGTMIGPLATITDATLPSGKWKNLTTTSSLGRSASMGAGRPFL